MHPVVRYKTKTSLLLNSLFSFHFPRHSSFELQLFNTNMVDTFRRLLYDISKRLSKEEVIDLVYLCKVPQSAQTKIQDGKDLFKHLEETGVISEQRIHTLKKVLYLLRPKRQDLLDLVDRKFPEDDNRSNRSISICTTNTINTVKSDTSGYSYVANTKHMLSKSSKTKYRRWRWCTATEEIFHCCLLLYSILWMLNNETFLLLLRDDNPSAFPASDFCSFLVFRKT